MGAGSAPRCPTPFAHGPMSPTKGCSSASVTPPRWQTLLNRLSSANPLASPGAVGLFPGNFHPPGAGGHSAASANVSSDVGTSCSHHLHSRLAPASLHRVALEASASIADAHLRHAPVSSPRPERPAARAHLNPMFRTESPKTEVQTAIAMLQAAEEEKERARRRRRDERAAAKEAKRLAGTSGGGARGAAERAARSRAEILARHRPARTDSLDSLDALDDRTSRSSQSGSDASSSDDDDDDDGDDGSGDSGTSSISEPTETKSGARRAGRHRRRHDDHHRHRHNTRHAAAKRRKTEEESKKRRRSTDDTDASEKHHKSKHHKSGKHHKSKHHKSGHHKSKHRESKRRHRKTGHRRKSSREPERAHRDGDVAADASRAARDRVDVNVRTKLDAVAERQERMEAECAGMRRVWSKTGLSETINRSCGNLVALIENAYGSFIAHPRGSSVADATPRPDSPIPA